MDFSIILVLERIDLAFVQLSDAYHSSDFRLSRVAFRVSFAEDEDNEKEWKSLWSTSLRAGV